MNKNEFTREINSLRGNVKNGSFITLNYELAEELLSIAEDICWDITHFIDDLNLDNDGAFELDHALSIIDRFEAEYLEFLTDTEEEDADCWNCGYPLADCNCECPECGEPTEECECNEVDI